MAGQNDHSDSKSGAARIEKGFGEEVREGAGEYSGIMITLEGCIFQKLEMTDNIKSVKLMHIYPNAET